jgi:hypothetical protein
MHFAEKATGYEAKYYPENKKSPLIQGLENLTIKRQTTQAKKGERVSPSPAAERLWRF